MTSIGWGKIILLGEHAVVYGYPALAAALDRGVTVAPVPTPQGGPLRLDLPAWDFSVAAATRSLADDTRLAELGALTDTGTAALVAGDLAALGSAMDRAHATLAGLGVSTPQLDSLCEAARAAGAYGAKLTGAGGGGAV